MQIADGGGTGRLGNDAAAAAAAEAARRAAAEAARKAAEEAARKAAEEAARKAAEEAARKAAEAAQRAAEEASQRNTGRLAEAKNMDMGHHPWEAGTAAAAGVVGAVAGSAMYQGAKDAMSVKKKIDDVRDVADRLRGAGQAADEAGSIAKAFGTANKVTKVVSGVQSALDLPNAIGALKDGASKDELVHLSKDVLGTTRGVEAVANLAGKSVLGKFNPVVAVAGAVTDGADRVNKLKDWGNLSTQDKISNIAGLGADVADVIGAVTPPPIKFAAMGISAGLGLISLGAQNWDKISGAAGTAVHAVGDAAKEVGHEIAHEATEAVHAVSNVAHKAADAVKNIFGGL